MQQPQKKLWNDVEMMLKSRAQPNWAYEFPNRTGQDMTPKFAG